MYLRPDSHLLYNEGRSVRPCAVVAKDDQGATLFVEGGTSLPDTLVLVGRNGTAKPCRVERRRLLWVDVVFESLARPFSPARG